MLTYMLLQQGRNSLYEPQAIGYTIVPGTLKALCRQRVRWARGMFDGLRSVAPWKQASFYGGYFESVNVSIIFLDLAYVFVFLPGIVLFFLGFDWLVGDSISSGDRICTITGDSVDDSIAYCFQKRLPGIAIRHSLPGFIGFALVFQAIQSACSLLGYFQAVFSKRLTWK